MEGADHPRNQTAVYIVRLTVFGSRSMWLSAQPGVIAKLTILLGCSVSSF